MNALQFDEAWQRCLDREMGRSEETVFLARLSEAERLELFATRAALGELECLPRISAPADLAARVMVAISPKKQSAFTRLRRWLESRPMLGWEFGGAALAASVLFVTLAPQFMTLPAGGSPHASPSLMPVSHAPGGNGGALQFSLYAPQARSVALIGDFNGWGSTAEIKLKPAANGMWSVAVPLPAGSYQYAFLLDDRRWVTDPRAERRVNDDFGRQNAVVTII
ncbi:MAG: isoamylase early set domain-containing protein [Betaproteobacteria bacterium]|nr:isoamylase early set domain-containing protein [Betaproteobacteria bacterium]